jgi:aldose 1-epimerase
MTVELGGGPDRVVVDPEQGGRVASLVIGDRERLLGGPRPGVVDPSLSWGSFLMAPFVGRLSEGLLAWNDRVIAIPANHGRHAIHGTVFDVAWGVVAQTENTVAMSCEIDQARWPFRGRVFQRISMTSGGLAMEAAIEADEAMPAALGWHPWFARGRESVRVGVAGDRVLRLNEELIPTGDADPVDARTDLREAPEMGARRLDDVYAGVRSPAELCWPDLRLQMAFGPQVGAVVVYNHPEAVCLEPMTAWPDAIRLTQGGCPDTGLVVLGPGQRLSAWTRWSWTVPAPAR